MKNKILLQLKSLTLNYEPELTEDIAKTIQQTVLGNPDGIRYRLMDSMKRLNETRPLHFISLRKNGELIFVMALIERFSFCSGQVYNTYYVRYVTFSQAYTAKTLTPESNSSAMKRMSNSLMKEGMIKHADDFTFTLNSPKTDSSKKLYYGYVEGSNLRSLNLTGFFFEQIRNITIITYSNLFPERDERVSKISSEDIDSMMETLEKQYHNHSFYFQEKKDIAENYFVLKHKGQIVAGLKAQVCNWKIEQLPGAFGKLIKNILPRIPFLSKIISKESFRFLTLDTIYCAADSNLHLPILFNSVCAQLKVYAALMYFDTEDPQLKQIKSLNKMGVLNRLYKGAKAVVVARFVNFTEEEKQKFHNNPVYIAGYDIT